MNFNKLTSHPLLPARLLGVVFSISIYWGKVVRGLLSVRIWQYSITKYYILSQASHLVEFALKRLLSAFPNSLFENFISPVWFSTSLNKSTDIFSCFTLRNPFKSSLVVMMLYLFIVASFILYWSNSWFVIALFHTISGCTTLLLICLSLLVYFNAWKKSFSLGKFPVLTSIPKVIPLYRTLRSTSRLSVGILVRKLRLLNSRLTEITKSSWSMSRFVSSWVKEYFLNNDFSLERCRSVSRFSRLYSERTSSISGIFSFNGYKLCF